MQWTLSLALLVVVAVAGVVAGRAEPVQLEYHSRVGVGLARRIALAEGALDFDGGGRIVGGAAASLGAYPYLGGLVIALTSGGTSVCGSSLLSNTRAVTAAHCWWDGRNQARQFTVVLGSVRLFTGGVRLTTSNVQMHGSYNTANLNNDIAIIVTGWVSYTNVIRAINLPTGSLQGDSFAGAWAQAAGFGRTSDNTPISTSQVLSHVNLQVITNAVCRQTFGGVIIASTLCTAGGASSPCSGDSGGPLSLAAGGQRVLVGVTSFVSARGCEMRLPAGFVRVSSFLAWIQARL